MLVACCDEPHCVLTVVAAASSGRPACSHAVRVTLAACMPTWPTHPPTTCPTSDGSMPERSTTARCTSPSRSAECMADSPPLRRPTGLRTASTTTTSRMTHRLEFSAACTFRMRTSKLPAMLPVVLVHGGGLDGRCWDPHPCPACPRPSIAVDLPGRGAHPADLRTVTFADCAESVRADIDAAGFDDVVLAGHSLAGCSMPSMIGLLGDRVRHAVFVACTVPETGKSAFDTLDPEVQAMARAGMEAAGDVEPAAMDGELAKLVLGNDLTDEQLEFCVERLVARGAAACPTVRSTSRRCAPTCRRRGCARCRT